MTLKAIPQKEAETQKFVTDMLKINFLLFTFPILNTLKEDYLAGSKCRYNRKIFFATFKQKVTVIKCQENSKIKMSREFKVTNCWNGKKPVLNGII